MPRHRLHHWQDTDGGRCARHRGNVAWRSERFLLPWYYVECEDFRHEGHQIEVPGSKRETCRGYLRLLASNRNETNMEDHCESSQNSHCQPKTTSSETGGNLLPRTSCNIWVTWDYWYVIIASPQMQCGLFHSPCILFATDEVKSKPSSDNECDAVPSGQSQTMKQVISQPIWAVNVYIANTNVFSIIGERPTTLCEPQWQLPS